MASVTLFDQVVSLENLLLASRRAMRGKKKSPRVADFYFNLENELVELHRELLTGTYKPRPYRTFVIHEPKLRQICAADFRDRVVHHALCHILDPVFEQYLIADTYACRVNKGTHRAIKRAQYFARHKRYFLKCDIRKYFDSIDHGVLKARLRKKIKDARVLDLLDQIIDHVLPDGWTGKGLPIGNLTSQYFANFYLGALDHHIKDFYGVKGYIRYMDDFILFADEKPVLYNHLRQIRHFARDTLKLHLKEKAVRLSPVMQGVPFLGFRVFPHLIRLQRSKWVRFKRRVRRLEEKYSAGQISEGELADRVQSMISHIQHADTYMARKTYFSESLCYF